MSPRARAAARQMHEETLSHVSGSPFSSADAFLDYDGEESIDLLVQGVSSTPRDVESGEARAVADVLDATFDQHAKSCEACRKSEYGLGNASTRGLARLTRVNAARRPVTWQALCPEGKRLFMESWRALGLGLPEYAR